MTRDANRMTVGDRLRTAVCITRQARSRAELGAACGAHAGSTGGSPECRGRVRMRGCADTAARASQALTKRSRYAVGAWPCQRLKARVKALCSEKPSRKVMSVTVFRGSSK